jgi:DNA-directed RNA polymerase beta' subunit
MDSRLDLVTHKEIERTQRRRRRVRDEKTMEDWEGEMKVWEPKGLAYMPYSEFDIYRREELDSLIPDNNGVYDFSKLGQKFVKVDNKSPSQDHGVSTGFNNLHLGAPNNGGLCQTCGNVYRNCQGHFGVIYLKKMLFFHQLFIGDLRYLLSCFCMESFEKTKHELEPDIHLVVRRTTIENDENFMATSGRERIRLIGLTKICEHCGAKNRVYKTRKVDLIEAVKSMVDEKATRVPSIKKNDKYLGLSWEIVGSRGETQNHLSEYTAYRLLRGFDILPDARRFEMLDMLGYTQHPYLSGLIVTHLIVVPPNYRNRRIMGAETSKQKTTIDETYTAILRCLEFNQEHPPSKCWPVLCNRLTTLFKTVLVNNTLAHKAGLMRRDLNGTRCNFSGRTVLTLNAWLPFDVVGIPEIFAERITRKVKVVRDDAQIITNNEIRLSKAEKMIQEGKIVSYFKSDLPTSRSIIRSMTSLPQIKPGYYVERKLQDGDYVLVNRQPTIHSRGVMAYRIKIIGGKSIQINMAATTPLHADFDGDEINIQVPQTAEAVEQCRNEGNVTNLILNPHDQGVMLGLVFELLDAGYRLSDDKTWVSREIYDDVTRKTFENNNFSSFDEIIERALQAGLSESEIFKEGKISGKLLFSTVLPRGFNHLNGSVQISNGVLIKGRLSNAHIGVYPGGSIIQALLLENPTNKEAVNFLNYGNRLLLSWQDHYPNTFGLDDFILGIGRKDRDNEKFKNIRKEYRDKINDTVNSLKNISNTVIWPMERNMFQRTLYQNWEKVGESINKYVSELEGKLPQDDPLFPGLMFFLGSSFDDKTLKYLESLKIGYRFNPGWIDDILFLDQEVYSKVSLANVKIEDLVSKFADEIVWLIAGYGDDEQFETKLSVLLNGLEDLEISQVINAAKVAQTPRINNETREKINNETRESINRIFNGEGEKGDKARKFIIQRYQKEQIALFLSETNVVENTKEARLQSRKLQAQAITSFCERIFTTLNEIPKQKIDYIVRLIKETLDGLAEHNPFQLVSYLPLIPGIIKNDVFDRIDDPIEREWAETTRMRQRAGKFSSYVGETSRINDLPLHSFIKIAKNAGSKGKDSYPGMDIAVGQVYLRGGFLPVFNNMNRCLVYDRDTIHPASRGFVQESLMVGVSPRSSFQMHMAGRESNIITADETPTSGYAHRRLGMILENIKVSRGHSLISGSQRLIQPVYGDDGFSSERMVSAKGIYGQTVYSFMDIKGCVQDDLTGNGYY